MLAFGYYLYFHMDMTKLRYWLSCDISDNGKRARGREIESKRGRGRNIYIEREKEGHIERQLMQNAILSTHTHTQTFCNKPVTK